ncbi:BatA domain-containing protein [bacterium]|nr:BatA domain-containing protein [bacterium]
MMPSFLHAAVLAGLAGVLLPILIHLLARPRPRTVVFSHLRFLRAVQERKARSFKLRRFLLLLLRVLAVAFLVLAFSRPFIPSGRASASKGVSAWVVDRSASLMAEDAWAVLRGHAARLAGLSSAGESVALEWTPRSGLSGDSLMDASSAAAAIEKSDPVWSAGDAADAIRRAARRTGRMPDADPEIFLLSDGQASGFRARRPSEDTEKWKGTLFVLPFRKAMDNAAVTEAAVDPAPLRRDEPLRLRAVIRNFGITEVRDRMVRFFAGDGAVAQKTVDLEPGAAVMESVPVMEETAGFIRGKVQTQPDGFPQDDERFFAAFHRPVSRILLVGGRPADLSRFRAALEPRPDSPSRFLTELRTPDQAWAPSLGKSDAVFFVNCPLRSAADGSALRRFIESGGGALFVPGPDSDLGRWNALLFTAVWGDSLVQAGVSGAGSGYLTLGPPDPDEPLLAGVFEPGWTPRRPPKFFRTVRPAAGGRRAPLRFTDGRPFLSEWPLGRGTLIVLSGGTDPDWSDFATSPLFPAIAVRCGQVLSALRDGAAGRALTGDSLVFFSGPAGSGGRFQVETPSGERVSVLPRLSGGKLRAVLKTADRPGLYRFFRDDSLEAVTAVNLDPAESDFRTIDEAGLKKLLPAARIVMLNAKEPLEDQIRTRRRGRELWREMLLLALICLVAETVVSAVWK